MTAYKHVVLFHRPVALVSKAWLGFGSKGSLLDNVLPVDDALCDVPELLKWQTTAVFLDGHRIPSKKCSVLRNG